jgi:hypothetical protein
MMSRVHLISDPHQNLSFIGSGTSIAYKLLLEEPATSTTVLKARQASSGATSQNDDHCGASRYLKFKTYLEKFREEDALRVKKLEEHNV